jgi:MFS family permease
MKPADQLGFGATLRIPGMRRLWLAQIVSIFGDFLAIFAVFTLVTFRLHGTPTQVTMILVAYLLPLAFVGPLAGAFVDRWDVRITMIASDLIRAVLAVLLLFVQDLNQIYAIFLALSIVSSFFLPAQSIALRTLVPQEGLLSANALMSQAMQVMQIVSPAIAGALAAWFGPGSCFWLDSGSFLFSAAMIFGITVHHRPDATPATVRSIASSVTEGMRFILTHAAVSFVILAMTAGMFAIRCFSALMAVYVRDVLAAGPVLFGALSSLVGGGMIAGTQLINRFARDQPKDRLVVSGLAGIGLFIVLTATLGSVAGTVSGMFGLGFCVAFIMIPAQTLLQQETPRPMLGRVSSSLWSVLSMAQIAAMLIAGPTAQSIGIRNLYFATGALNLAFAAAGFLQLRRHAQQVAS